MISWFFIGLVITILFTPGPTNTLLASSGVQVGVRKSLLLIPAEALGYIVAITAWGMLIGKVSTALPLLPTFLKLMSAGYILYLAIKLWRTANQQVALNQPTIRPRELLFATLLNPKALLFASAIFPAVAWKSQDIYLAHMSAFVGLILPIALFWISVGDMLATNKVKWLSQSKLQRTASVVLISFSIPISYSALINL
ncbi:MULTISPECIES: LysE family translocator [Acinetobacter]|uniref:LysE family translocator n=1 Tax=Acinetobacter TaxID=469 RepID=UPI0005B3B20B|nr:MULTISPECIES: LysE family transporter [Acinetobacter]AWA48677.1 LysE family translocator [Acinetobacter junii]MDH1005956.1 LysE family transporter [Acinetobacter junii]MDI6621426.1 LysE family transporter [Acinetobacter junii]QXR27088.1 LysE family transporter [Acinetobacter junii]